VSESPSFRSAEAVFKPNLPYKYPNNLIPVILPANTGYEDGTDRMFQNVDTQNSYAGELPKRRNMSFRMWQMF